MVATEMKSKRSFRRKRNSPLMFEGFAKKNRDPPFKHNTPLLNKHMDPT